MVYDNPEIYKIMEKEGCDYNTAADIYNDRK
jgi:hypothetical protein